MADSGCPFTVTPLDVSQVIAGGTIFNLNYTNQDFWSMKTRLIDYIKQNFGTSFNDFVESDLSIMLIENQAFIADTLSFKIDQIANEVFIDTVTEIDNAFRLCIGFGFQPQPPIAASSLWVATMTTAIQTDLHITTPYDVTLSAGGTTLVIELFPADANNQPIFNQDIIIPAGSVQNFSIIGLEGQTFQQQVTGTGQINQSYLLTFSPVIWQPIMVQVDGVTWTQVDYFTDSQRRQEYRVEFTSTYQAYIIFGTSRAGFIPTNGSQILVTYRVGGGARGNIVTGYATTQGVFSVEGLDFSVPVSFQNYTAGQNGYDGDTIDDIRTKLPDYIRSQGRAVTGLDYKTQADQFATPYSGQVGKSTAILRNYGCAGNIIDLYILALVATDGLTTASDALKVELQEYISTVQMLTDFVCIRDGTVISVDVTIDVTLDKFYKKFQDDIQTRITRRTTQFFALANWDYAQTLKSNDLTKALSDIQEITSIDIHFITTDPDNSGMIVVARFNEIIRNDNVVIAFTYT